MYAVINMERNKKLLLIFPIIPGLEHNISNSIGLSLNSFRREPLRKIQDSGLMAELTSQRFKILASRIWQNGHARLQN